MKRAAAMSRALDPPTGRVIAGIGRRTAGHADQLIAEGNLEAGRTLKAVRQITVLHLRHESSRWRLNPKPRSALDVGLGSIVACRHFVVPAAILVLVRDARRVSRHDLFLRCALGC